MKKLSINAATCDVRKVQEDTLSAYESIEITAALLLTNARASALLAKLPVDLNVASTLDCGDDEDIRLNALNGKTVLSGKDIPAGGRQYLMVNGKCTITPDAAPALDHYAGIMVNGVVYCPKSLASKLASLATVNGAMSTYPDDAVILKKNTKLDRVFLLRAKDALYWTDGTIYAMDDTLDAAALAVKGARFEAETAVISDAIAENLAPLFSEDTELVLVPAGTKLVDDDLKLTPATLRRYGSNLYVTGDVEIDAACAGLLESVEALIVKGDLIAPAELEDELLAIPQLEYDELYLGRGRILCNKAKVQVEGVAINEDSSELSCIACAKVLIAPDVPSDVILKKLHLDGCAKVCCTAEQLAAVQAVSNSVAKFETSKAKDDEDADEGSDTVRINAMNYTL